MTPGAASETLDVDALYRAHGHVVLRRARQLMGDDQEALDVLQDVFTALVQRPEQFAGHSAFTTWLYSATTHRCLNQLRNRKTRKRLLARQPPRDEAPPRAEDLAQARQVLAQLPDKLAQVAVYTYFDEMTQDEIAELLGCSRRQVGKLLEKVAKQVARREVRA
jgi:RNA polymerase sigma-70 factor (ECF subfamily)